MMIDLEQYEVDLIKIALSTTEWDNPTQERANELICRFRKTEILQNSELGMMVGTAAHEKFGHDENLCLTEGFEIVENDEFQGVGIPAWVFIEFADFMPENYMYDEHGRVRPRVVIEAEEAAQ